RPWYSLFFFSFLPTSSLLMAKGEDGAIAVTHGTVGADGREYQPGMAALRPAPCRRSTRGEDGIEDGEESD
ncbi:hypothetical protein PMAYCL1PPCAC_15298, partial [Pristionchus mayeri]